MAEEHTILSQALVRTGIIDVARASTDKNSVKLLFRVQDKRLWLSIIEYVLIRAEGWSAHICQQYFLRGKSLVYGWNFILQPTTAVEVVAGLLRQATIHVPKVLGKGQLNSFPLVGASPLRTARIVFDPRLPGPDRGGNVHKGAYFIGAENG